MRKNSRSPTSKEMANHREYMRSCQTPRTNNNVQVQTDEYQDSYQRMDLPRSASHADVKRMFRTIALQYHPDRNSSSEAKRRWEGVPEAYSTLSDPNSKISYDDSLPTRDALVQFYATYNPNKLTNVTIDTIIEGWTGREIELFAMLQEKYEIMGHYGIASNDNNDDDDKECLIRNDSVSSEDSTSSCFTRLLQHVANARRSLSQCFQSSYAIADTQSPESEPCFTPRQTATSSAKKLIWQDDSNEKSPSNIASESPDPNVTL